MRAGNQHRPNTHCFNRGDTTLLVTSLHCLRAKDIAWRDKDTEQSIVIKGIEPSIVKFGFPRSLGPVFWNPGRIEKGKIPTGKDG